MKASDDSDACKASATEAFQRSISSSALGRSEGDDDDDEGVVRAGRRVNKYLESSN